MAKNEIVSFVLNSHSSRWPNSVITESILLSRNTNKLAFIQLDENMNVFARTTITLNQEDVLSFFKFLEHIRKDLEDNYPAIDSWTGSWNLDLEYQARHIERIHGATNQFPHSEEIIERLNEMLERVQCDIAPHYFTL